MRAKSGLLSTGLLAGVLTAATAQTIPCAAVAPEVRDRVRADGACADSATERPQRAAASGAAPKATRASARRSTPEPKSARSVRPETVPVPSVVGATIESAQARLQEFEIERADRPSQAPAGEVIEQSPDASAPATAGSRVSLVVSSGPPMVQVPNVVDRSYDEASAALSAFSTVRIEVPGPAPSGKVLTQEPVSGSMVAPGSRVALQVSDGSLAGVAAVAPAAVAATAATAADGRSLAFHGSTLLAVVASLLLGAALGALAMRQWLLRHQLQGGDATVAPAHEPVVTVGPDSPPADPAPAVRFFARLDAGEIAIEFPRVVDSEEPVTESASER